MNAQGDFSNIGNPDILDDAYKAVTLAEAWDWLKNPAIPGNRGFMMLSDPMLSKIMKHMKHDHSGLSFTWVMREMEFIAKNGWVEYIKSTV
jgi:hypothetical protein